MDTVSRKYFSKKNVEYFLRKIPFHEGVFLFTTLITALKKYIQWRRCDHDHSWYSCNTVITQSWYSHGQSWYSHRSMNRGRNLYGDHTVDLFPITDPVHVTGTVYRSQALCKHRPWVDMINLLPPFTQTIDVSNVLNRSNYCIIYSFLSRFEDNNHSIRVDWIDLFN